MKEREYQYTVDINAKTCDCRRWNLTGIPCNHAISCLRHERIVAEDVIPSCYSTVYGFNIIPCADKSNWEKMNGPNVKPPVYEKKIGRPPKSRRKQPQKSRAKMVQQCQDMEWSYIATGAMSHTTI